MVRRSSAALIACCLASFALVFTNGQLSELSAAGKKSANKPPIRNPKFDPTAEQVEFFAAIDAGQIEVKLIPKNALSGNVLIENKTDKPLNVKVPEAAVGVPMNFQFGGGGQQGGFGGGQQGGQQGGGQQQQGGGMGGGQQGGFGGGGGQQGGGGGGFFSVPPERVISVQFNSVCLEHGKPEPTPSSRYKLVPVSQVSDDPVLYELLTVVGTGKVDSQAAQAATWHLTDKMSFPQLAEKAMTRLGGQPPTPYFSQAQLQGAQQLLALSAKKAEERKDKKPATEQPTTSRVTGTVTGTK
ncbi:MAG: hypothetical protein AABP62_16775 [Planctomycetota bacterium]